MERQTSRAPPDGGWGWMVVFGAALINMVNQAMFANFGLIFGEYLKELGGGHATGITLVLAISVVVTNFAGLMVGPMLKVLEIRIFTLMAIGCVGTGMIISSFGTATWHIIIGYSILTGFGLGLLASGTFLIINDYFTTKKSTAVGISMAGTAIGQMTMPTLIGILLKKYEYSWTTFILGCISYSGAIGALCFRPLICCQKQKTENDVENGNRKVSVNGRIGDKVSLDPKEEEEEKLMGNSNGNRKVSTEETTPERKISENEWKNFKSGQNVTKCEPNARGMIKSYSQALIKNHVEVNYKESAIAMASSQYQVKQEEKHQHCLQKVSKALGFDLVKDPIYVHIVVGLGLVYVSSVSFGAFFPLFLQDEADLTMSQTTITMTCLSTADVVGRITVSEICRRMKLSNRKTFMIGTLILAITRSIEVMMPDFTSLAVVAFIVGYFRAIAVINQNLVISEYISKDNLPSAVGLNMVTKALLTSTVGQALGFIKDAWSYMVCIHLLNIVIATVVISWYIEMSIMKRRTAKILQHTESVPTAKS